MQEAAVALIDDGVRQFLGIIAAARWRRRRLSVPRGLLWRGSGP